MRDILLSVIIPIYNCEKYVSRCIDSVLNQKYNYLEIIIVNDGSSDNTLEICKTYEKRDNRVKLFTIENSGSYQARKYGALHANGEVITFIDADDYLDMDAYKNLMEIYQKYSPDIISYTFQLNNLGETFDNYLQEGFYDRVDLEKKIIPSMLFDIKTGHRLLNPSLGCKLIKRELFLRVVAGNEDRITWGDDAMVIYPLICIARNLYMDVHPYYHYYMNEASSTHLFSYKIIDDLRTFKERLLTTLSQFYPMLEWNFAIDSYIRTYAEMMFNKWLSIHRTACMYIFPYHLILYKSRVQIYGAGEVGKSYVVELLQSGYADIVGWYDKNKCGERYCQINISVPTSIIEEEADFILIAIDNDNIAKEIHQQLLKDGIDSKKIKWEKPVIRA